jgi:hypothetical protein
MLKASAKFAGFNEINRPPDGNLDFYTHQYWAYFALILQKSTTVCFLSFYFICLTLQGLNFYYLRHRHN